MLMILAQSLHIHVPSFFPHALLSVPVPFLFLRFCHFLSTFVLGFLEKNTDTLFKDLARLMFTSGNAVLKSCFPEGDESLWAGASKRCVLRMHWQSNQLHHKQTNKQIAHILALNSRLSLCCFFLI